MAILLMTATLQPPAAAIGLARRDPVDRLGDYLSALAFYLQALERGQIDAIVFCDNSNADLSALKRLASASSHHERVEFLSFSGVDHPEYGRGYGEMRLVDRTMRHSLLIGAAGAETMVWKVTGRYRVGNLERLMRVKGGKDLYCHCRNIPRRWADMYFMGWKIGAYSAMLEGVYVQLNERLHGRSAEVEFRRHIDAIADRFEVQRRFGAPPRLEGIRGYDNRRYDEERGKIVLRNAFSWALPFIWI